MNNITLQNLILDRALGELSPEVESLLDAYLTHDSESSIVSDELMETVVLASRALAQDKTSRTVTTAFVSLVKPNLFRFPGHWTLKIAAVFAAGLALGFIASPAPRLAPQTAIVLVKAPPQEPSSFWSKHNLLPATNQTLFRHQAVVSWNSPVRNPQIHSQP